MRASRDLVSLAKICPAGAAAIAQAAAIIRGGGLVAFPTETVYGLGGDATSNDAIARIYAAKTRPANNPLIAHVEDTEAAFEQGFFSAEARRLARLFWPGPLTLVVPAGPGTTVCPAARAGLSSLALRVPKHPVARALIAAVKRPVAAPSANRSGRLSPVSPAHAARDLASEIDLILDGGLCQVGVESTVVACLDGPPHLLRPGGISRADIEAALGQKLSAREGMDVLAAPGMLPSHYAPRAALRLNAANLEAGEAGLDFGGLFGAHAHVRDLSPSRNLKEAAAHLFRFLHELDALGLSTIAVAPIPDEGLGEAINDRLCRAAVR
ncbi:MAG TPA: L-threonylcarbamoyladenylate synthase [Methylocella sp.]|nr:L-threonylcarbamoyladenylate synthase [Methylocella sp.]